MSTSADWIAAVSRIAGPILGGVITVASAWGLYLLSKHSDRRNQFIDICNELQRSIGSLLEYCSILKGQAEFVLNTEPMGNSTFDENELIRRIHSVQTNTRVAVVHTANDQIHNTLESILESMEKALAGCRETNDSSFVYDYASLWAHIDTLVSALVSSLETNSKILVEQLRSNPPQPNPRIIKV